MSGPVRITEAHERVFARWLVSMFPNNAPNDHASGWERARLCSELATYLRDGALRDSLRRKGPFREWAIAQGVEVEP